MMLPPIPWVLGGAAVVALAGWLLARKKTPPPTTTGFIITGQTDGSGVTDNGPAPALFAPCADGSSLHAYGGQYDGECLSNCPPGYSQLGATCIWQGQTATGADAWIFQTTR